MRRLRIHPYRLARLLAPAYLRQHPGAKQANLWEQVRSDVERACEELFGEVPEDLDRTQVQLVCELLGVEVKASKRKPHKRPAPHTRPNPARWPKGSPEHAREVLRDSLWMRAQER